MNTIGIITYDKYGRMIYRILNCSYTFIFSSSLCFSLLPRTLCIKSSVLSKEAEIQKDLYAPIGNPNHVLLTHQEY